MQSEILNRLKSVAIALDIDSSSIKLDYPENPDHGDFSSNLAMMGAKKAGTAPRALAEKIVTEFSKEMPSTVKSVDIAGPGFINFKIKDEVFEHVIFGLASEAAKMSRRMVDSYPQMKGGDVGRTVMVEYTDPNPFKIFHIGHLMSNAIGESISRLIQFTGANVKRANWQGDVGLHVAKTIWGIQKSGLDEFEALEKKDLVSRVTFLGKAYALGAAAYEDAENKSAIEVINKQVFDHSDEAVNDIYDKGRKWSLDYFETIYGRLGTKFDYYFFEGKEGLLGAEIVRNFLDKDVFEKSEGAVVFKGEKYGLHTRVFINSQGLPTYEAKELGLNHEKFQVEKDLDESIIVTGNEITEYFKVLKKVMELIYPDIAKKTRHIPHGMLRLTSGKMSSRTGQVVAAEDLINDVREMVMKKIADRDFTKEEANEISDAIAVGAIKYSILRASIGGDIIYDRESSISFEGDSGPYLQYSAVRAKSVLDKARQEKIPALTAEPEEDEASRASDELILSMHDYYGTNETSSEIPVEVGFLERLISRFPDIAERARREYAPQIVANYLVALAGEFNSFYANQVIVDSKNPLSPYYVAVTRAFRSVMEAGLWLLGIKVPPKM